MITILMTVLDWRWISYINLNRVIYKVMSTPFDNNANNIYIMIFWMLLLNVGQ